MLCLDSKKVFRDTSGMGYEQIQPSQWPPKSSANRPEMRLKKDYLKFSLEIGSGRAGKGQVKSRCITGEFPPLEFPPFFTRFRLASLFFGDSPPDGLFWAALPFPCGIHLCICGFLRRHTPVVFWNPPKCTKSEEGWRQRYGRRAPLEVTDAFGVLPEIYTLSSM